MLRLLQVYVPGTALPGYVIGLMGCSIEYSYMLSVLWLTYAHAHARAHLGSANVSIHYGTGMRSC